MKNIKRRSNRRLSKVGIALLAIFLLAFFIRLLPLLMHGHPIGMDAYYHFRQAEEFKSGFPEYDALSMGGRPYSYWPTFHVFLAGMSLLTTLPVEIIGPIIVTLIGSITVLIIFLITRHIFRDNKAALLSAAFSAVIPVFLWKTASNTLVTSIDIFLFATVLLFVLQDKKLQYFVTSIILFAFSPATGILGLSLYAFTLKKNRLNRSTIIWIALLVIFVLISLSFYADFTKIYVSKDLPEDVNKTLYEKISIEGFLLRLNPAMLALGIAGLYSQRKRYRQFLPVVALLVFFAIAFVAEFLETDRALVYLGIFLSIFTGVALSKIRPKSYAPILIAVIFVASLALGVYSLKYLEWSAISDYDYDALTWIKYNTPTDAVIMAAPVEGHWVTYVSQRKNIVDSNLLGAQDLAERYNDVKTFYHTSNLSARDEITNKYNVSYVVFSEKAIAFDPQFDVFGWYEIAYQNTTATVFRVT